MYFYSRKIQTVWKIVGNTEKQNAYFRHEAKELFEQYYVAPSTYFSIYASPTSQVNHYLPSLFPPAVLIEIPLYLDTHRHIQLFQYCYFSS